MELKNLYYEYVLKTSAISFSWSEKILFEIVRDFIDRRGLKQEWYQIDDEIQNEILNTWLLIIKKREPNPWIFVIDNIPEDGSEVLTYSPKTEDNPEQFRIIKFGSIGSGFPFGVEKWKYLEA